MGLVDHLISPFNARTCDLESVSLAGDIRLNFLLRRVPGNITISETPTKLQRTTEYSVVGDTQVGRDQPSSTARKARQAPIIEAN